MPPEKDTKPIDHSRTDKAVCPWCGHVQRESWEYRDDQETDCGECSKPFVVNVNVKVTYSTMKVE